MDLPGNWSDVAAKSACGFEYEPNEFWIQRWPPQPFAFASCDFQPSDCSLFDKRSLKLGDCHKHTKLELADRILLGGIDPLACADQRDVPYLKFADDNREMSQTAPKPVELVGYDLVDASSPDLRQQLLEAWATRRRARC